MPIPAPNSRRQLPTPRIYSSNRTPRPIHDPSFAHVLYENTFSHHPSFNPPPPSSVMFSYLAHSPWMNNQVHLSPSNPYPNTPPPPPVTHKVWILDCKSCGTFLTNRGMKAVLLLRPNVHLYSSDALPINCSAYTSNPESIRAVPSRPSASSIPPRTCECLTQTLCCHSCGGTVGYMIVIPCARCTSSISASNRATNGHRFVFHSSEVTGTERRYIEDEPGVIPFEAAVITSSPSPLPLSPSHPLMQPPPYISVRDPHAPQHHRDQIQPHASPSLRSDYMPTPPLEFAHPPIVPSSHPVYDSALLPEDPTLDSYVLPQSLPPFSQHYRRVHSPHLSRSSHSVSPAPQTPHIAVLSSVLPPTSEFSLPLTSEVPLNDTPADYKEQPVFRTLKQGEVLFWHHLSRSGEIPGVADDKRARGCTSPKASGIIDIGNVMFNR